MPLINKLKYLLICILLAFSSLYIYSCKDEDVTGPGDDDPDNETGQIVVLAPASSDTLTASGFYEILWQSNLTTDVKIEYSSDGGGTWNTIEERTENTGIYIWDPVPAISSITCRIRITTVDDAASDINPGNFKILPSTNPMLNLTRPNGGEFLFAGEAYTITWAATDITQVKLEFSPDNGNSWNVIVPNFPGDSGSYNWGPIPDVVTSTALVRISDVNSPTMTDVSNTTFSVGHPQEIRVLSPNGGEEWPAKSSKVITWYSSQISKVKIEYSNNNGVDWYTIESETESDGYYIWNPLPDLPSTNARIRISDPEDNYPSDASDNVFTVAPEEALSIIEPNGGEQWLSGSTQNIVWNGIKTNKRVAGVGGNQSDFLKKSPLVPATVSTVRIEYTTNSGATWVEVAKDLPNNGFYTWGDVPNANSSLCKVRISDMQDGTPSDMSDSAFTIYNSVQQELTVTAPNGGEVWQAGTTQTITWTSINVAAVKIEYSSNNGLTWNTVINNTPSDGYYNWNQVPSTASTNCRIRVSDADDNFPSDFSNAVFSVAPEPEITILSPNGGESLQAGSTANLRWTSTNISDVRIEYTTNNGASWSLINASTPSDGNYEWIVADLNSSLCRIRMSDADDNQPFDISDNNFAITNQVVQSLSLFNPNGGEKWEAGTSHNITWSAAGITNVKVEFTTNNGLTWSVLKDSVSSSGSVEWTPLNINSTQCKIRISDHVDGLPVDESDGPFTIEPIQSLEVLIPRKDQVIIAGEPFDIKWKAVGIEKVRIEYTLSNAQGTGWITLVESVPSMGQDGTYRTSFSAASTEYRLRVSDAADGSPVAYNDGVFTVAPQPVKTITITSPNGKENWLSNETYEIRWESTNIDEIKLEYTINGGATWNWIADTYSNGLYNWKVPPITYRSDLCKIKATYIIGDSVTTLSDYTDDFFSIHPQSKMLRVVFPNGEEAIQPEGRPDTVIQWRSAGIEFVKIELSLDNGINWQSIFDENGNSADFVPSSGAFRWLLPPLSTLSTNARIRITDVSPDAGDPAETDMSDSYFNLNVWQPRKKVISPKLPTTGSGRK